MLVRAWGTAPAEGFHVGLAVEDPAEFTAAAFMEALSGRGVRVAGAAASRHKFTNGTGEFAGERAEPLKLRAATTCRQWPRRWRAAGCWHGTLRCRWPRT